MTPRAKFSPDDEQDVVLSRIARLSRQIVKLRSEYGEALALARSIGVPYSEVARAAGKNVGTVHRTINREREGA